MKLLYKATALAALLATGCGNSDTGTQASSTEAPAPPSAPILSVEQALASADLSPIEFDDDAMALAANKVDRGDPLLIALQQIGPSLGAPNQSAANAINWLKRMPDGDCGNLMLHVSDGLVTRVAYTEFPKGSQGEAKCQNWLQ